MKNCLYAWAIFPWLSARRSWVSKYDLRTYGLAFFTDRIASLISAVIDFVVIIGLLVLPPILSCPLITDMTGACGSSISPSMMRPLRYPKRYWQPWPVRHVMYLCPAFESAGRTTIMAGILLN